MNEKLQRQIVAVCSEIAEGRDIVSICLYGSQAGGYARKDSDYDVLLVLERYPEGVRYYYKTVEDKQFAILIVDHNALKLDAENGDLGDFVAGRLLSPYIVIVNPEQMLLMEDITKRRFAEEDLEDLIIEYGELSRGLVIKPEYLVLARMEKRSKAYPPLKYSYINMLRGERKDTNMKLILNGYRRVLDYLANSRIVKIEKNNITLVNEYIDKVLSYKIRNRVINLMDFSKRTIYSYITHGKAGKVRLNVVAKELASKIKREIQTTFNGKQLEDPKNYLFLKMEKGLINLNKKDEMIEKIQRITGNKEVDVKPLTGALNEVYLITIDDDILVIKKFTDWFNLKWFILNIAVYGTKSFHLSGKARLTNEYVINQLLAENNILVPEIVAISVKDRILVERYIKGNPFVESIIKFVRSNNLTTEQKKLVLDVGKLLARIHEANITVGDCKPENFIVGEDHKIYTLDLEQGERYGDKVWDVAEFLYFSGHYATKYTGGLQEFVQEFIVGYSSIMDKEILRKAAGLRYAKVFLTWTLMPVIQEISTALKNTP